MKVFKPASEIQAKRKRMRAVWLARKMRGY